MSRGVVEQRGRCRVLTWLTDRGPGVMTTDRLVTLIHLDGIKSNIVVPALRDHVLTLPEQLRRSVTWDQGKEMALHAQFTLDTGIQIYLCDPSRPGSAAPTRTPTGCSASTSHAAPTSRATPSTTSTPSPPSSTGAPARPLVS